MPDRLKMTLPGAYFFAPLSGRQSARQFSLSDVSEWLSGRFGVSEFARQKVPTAVRLFLGYLTKCGFLQRDGDSFIVLHSGLFPPARRDRPAPSAPVTTVSNERKAQPFDRKRWVWREWWPSHDVVSMRVREAAARHGGAKFDAHQFLDSLYAMSTEPSEAAVTALVVRCGGAARSTIDLLKDIGVVEESWRMLRDGVQPPWRKKRDA
jgi:hypothetical protein